MKVAFILIGLISLSAGSQLTCRFQSVTWLGYNFQVRNYQTCIVEDQAVASPDSTIQPFSKEKATAITMQSNKEVKHVPTNLAALPELLAIELIFCAISSIGDHFKGLRELVFLHLGWNQIEDIQNDAFVENVKLEFLALDSNNLTHVNGELFKTLSNLKTLFLARNQIESIESSAFTNLINLEVLQLSSNKLTFIEAKSFQNLIKLKILDLYDNKIDSIDPETFDALKSLVTLDLSNNICVDKNYDSSSLKDLRNDVMTKCKPNSKQINETAKEILTTNENCKSEIKTEILNLSTKLTTLMDAMKSEIMNLKAEIKSEIGAIREEFAGALKTEQGRSESCSQMILEMSRKLDMVNTNSKAQKLKEFEKRYDSCMKILE